MIVYLHLVHNLGHLVHLIYLVLILSLFRLPGGTERVINTKSTTVVDDIVEDLCKV